MTTTRNARDVTRFGGSLPVVATVLVLLVVLAFALVRLTRDDDLRISASFPRVVGLYPGDEVRILGVPVGNVEKIERAGDGVSVRLRVDAGIQVPAEASVVIIAPSLVSGRYVQLTPAYSTGAVMAQGAVIPAGRTQVPIEFDELKSALNRFGQDLGPDAKDGKGPLGRAVDVAAANLDGQGQSMHDTLAALSAAVGTLADSRGDIFATVRNLAEFTEMLARADAQMRGFTVRMTDLSGQLARSRELLASTLQRLNRLLPQLKAYLAEERPLLRANVQKLNEVTTLLERNRQNIADILQLAPGALANTYNIYDPRTRSAVGAMMLPYQTTPGQFVCWLFGRVGAADACNLLEPIFGGAADATAAGRTTLGGVGSLLTPAGAP